MEPHHNGKNHRHDESGNCGNCWVPRNWRHMAITLIWMVVIVLFAHCSGLGPFIMPQLPHPQWKEDDKQKKDRHQRKAAFDDSGFRVHAGTCALPA